ncbi:hypothetical protein EVAR_76713_1 [Eumeta japonica]|uniref:Uncharacterized protein n=1 Tax=Eumeta variegata TaxID=151549 RepID=A0A4C1STJ0_EUMVA|nr:hypothetical protein EVAR_76713_1 [Eumeta japonica]
MNKLRKKTDAAPRPFGACDRGASSDRYVELRLKMDKKNCTTEKFSIENVTLKTSVSNLYSRINRLKQFSRANNGENQRVPERKK